MSSPADNSTPAVDTADSDTSTRADLPFHPAVSRWFQGTFPAPTAAQRGAWQPISQGDNTLLLAPTGSGKTLAAFLVAINRIMFPPDAWPTQPDGQAAMEIAAENGVRTLYISPLKALGVDVQRNLRAPLAGITAVAQRDGYDFHAPVVGVRSGDTPTIERQRMVRQPPDILITTPESLFLILTSRARSILSAVDTVIIDEIHTMVPTKRGSHLFLTLERLEQWREQHGAARPMQRIGLSATQRPLDEVARLLGGAAISTKQSTAMASASSPATEQTDENADFDPRPVTVVEAGRRKPMELTIEVPIEDMTQPAAISEQDSPTGSSIPSIWPSIHPRLVALIRDHHSTMIFVNSRRLAERLATAINEEADEELALAHHGSIAKDRRLLIEDRLKRGTLPAIVATSSLELGIDMGAVDLVIQIESPPSIASGIQRIGRAGHQVGAASEGVIFPKYRGDLLACSAATKRMLAGEVEETFYPRNPLDVLAQQIVAMVALEERSADSLFELARRAAPFTDLPRALFDGVLDLLSGRYPSNEFSELRPRVNWDRITGVVSPRRGTQRLAIANAGTIPDRGLYGVFLAGGEDPTDQRQRANRVGELDEEMVFECQPGDVFLLGASSWRVLDITHDRVIVEPAPGAPGRMPFWRGEGLGRPLEFGRAIGALAQELATSPRQSALQQLQQQYCLDQRASANLINYVHDQVAATELVPSDRTIVVERFVDEVGDWRIMLMSPFGSRVHAPWAMAAMARLQAEVESEIDMIYSDDGIVFRLPGSDAPPNVDLLLPTAEEVEDIVVGQLGGTALFAARFRENAARALLLPRRQPGRRTPLWLQRRKSADLLAVAARYERFPIMLETYRECLRDVFDLRGLRQILHEVTQRKIRVHVVDTDSPSPFGAALLFNYTANFIYNGDAPLAERRAATLALDHVQLRQLLGDAQLRDLLDADVIVTLGIELRRQDGRYPLRDDDSVRDLLRIVGDLDREELGAYQCADEFSLESSLETLLRKRQIVELKVADQPRFIAVEDAGRYRDALGCSPPLGVPSAFLESQPHALLDLVSRYARTHCPFQPDDIARRLGLGIGPIRSALQELQQSGRLIEGEFIPGGRGREWCDVSVLKKIKQRSLAQLRSQVQPVEADRYARFLSHWQGLQQPRAGLDALLDVLEQLQGLPLPISEWERAILPARLRDYQVGQLDALCAAGEIVWRGFSAIGAHDGRVAFYLTDARVLLAPAPLPVEDPMEQQIVAILQQRGACFFDAITAASGLFPHDALEALWRLVWAGHVTNDTTAPLRALTRSAKKKGKDRRRSGFRSRRTQRLPGSEGRWSLWPESTKPSTTEHRTAVARQLIERYGVLTRECVAAEGIAGGFSAIYPILKAMEEAGQIRRGYFVVGQGAAQFAAPGADDRLRHDESETSDDGRFLMLATTDPANPYGAALKWPEKKQVKSRPMRSAGSRVLLDQGAPLAYLTAGTQKVVTFLPDIEPDRSVAIHNLVEGLVSSYDEGPLFIKTVDNRSVHDSELAGALREHGFVAYGSGYQRKRGVT